MPTNPHSFMSESDPASQGEKNKGYALTWVYKFGYSTAPIIQLLLGHAGMSWTAGAVDGGWVRRTSVTARERIKLITLTSKGLAWVEERRDEIFKYPEVEPHRISPVTVWHNLLAQRITIHCVRTGEAAGFRTERQEASKSRRGEKKPDVVLITKARERIGVEIELNNKWDQRFDEFVSSTISALSPSPDGAAARFQKFIVFTTSPALASRYAAAFQPDAPLRIWRNVSKSDYVLDRTVKVPEWVRDRVEFRVITDTGKLRSRPAKDGASESDS